MKKLVLFTAALSLTFYSCDKDEVKDDPVIDVAQDKANIRATMNAVASCAQTLKDGDMYSAMDEFLGLTNGEALNEDWLDEVLGSLEDVPSFEGAMEDDRLNFETLKGTYTYDNNSKSWSHAANSNNNVVILFPSKPSSTSNNATITFSGYEDVKYTWTDTWYDDYLGQEVTETEEAYLPKKGSIKLEIDGSKLMELTLNNLTLENMFDELVPTDVDVSLHLAPYDFAVKFGKETDTKIAVSYSMGIGNDCSAGIDMSADLKHGDMENIVETDIDQISGSVYYQSLKLEASLDFDGLYNVADEDDPTVAQLNEFVTVKVLYDNVHVADLTFVETTDEDGYEDIGVELSYRDDTTEDFIAMVEDLLEDLEAVFDEDLDI